MMKANHYEPDVETFPVNAYKVDGHEGVAWRVLGWETASDDDTEWSGIEERTGRVVAVMIGDDRRFAFEPDDIHAIDDLAFCAECGQIGCAADGRDRS